MLSTSGSDSVPYDNDLLPNTLVLLYGLRIILRNKVSLLNPDLSLTHGMGRQLKETLSHTPMQSY